MFIISERITIEILIHLAMLHCFIFLETFRNGRVITYFFLLIILHIRKGLYVGIFCVHITCTFCNICITLLLKIYGTFFIVYLRVFETHKSLTVVLASMRKIWAPFVQLLDLKNLVCMLLTLLRKGLGT